MATRSIQILAFIALSLASTAVAIAMSPGETNACRLPMVADTGSVELASMFREDGNTELASDTFADAPRFIFAMNDSALESQAKLLDVSNVLNCGERKNVI